MEMSFRVLWHAWGSLEVDAMAVWYSGAWYDSCGRASGPLGGNNDGLPHHWAASHSPGRKRDIPDQWVTQAGLSQPCWSVLPSPESSLAPPEPAASRAPGRCTLPAPHWHCCNRTAQATAAPCLFFTTLSHPALFFIQYMLVQISQKAGQGLTLTNTTWKRLEQRS